MSPKSKIRQGRTTKIHLKYSLNLIRITLKTEPIIVVDTSAHFHRKLPQTVAWIMNKGCLIPQAVSSIRARQHVVSLCYCLCSDALTRVSFWVWVLQIWSGELLINSSLICDRLIKCNWTFLLFWTVIPASCLSVDISSWFIRVISSLHITFYLRQRFFNSSRDVMVWYKPFSLELVDIRPSWWEETSIWRLCDVYACGKKTWGLYCPTLWWKGVAPTSITGRTN